MHLTNGSLQDKKIGNAPSKAQMHIYYVWGISIYSAPKNRRSYFWLETLLEIRKISEADNNLLPDSRKKDKLELQRIKHRDILNCQDSPHPTTNKGLGKILTGTAVFATAVGCLAAITY